MKKVLLFLLFVSCLDLSASQLSWKESVFRLNDALKSSNGPRVRLSSSLKQADVFQLAYTAEEDGMNLLYVVNNTANGGFYILSADDCAPAVLGYGDKSFFDWNKAPEALKWLMSEYRQAIRTAIEESTTLEQMVVSDVAVEPLLTSKWGQDSPFNLLCTDNGYQAPSGCVATAMSQVMYYHQWPVTGKGSHFYTDDTSGKEVRISSSFYDHTYDWANMLDDYTGVSAQSVNAAAVSLLMKDCGISIDMSYGRSESGANSFKVPRAFTTYFGYSKAVKCYHRLFYTEEEWNEIIFEQLEKRQPIMYAGYTSKDEGHSFVLDGYDGNGRFHINWGWDGSCDGYYAIHGKGALKPAEMGTGGGSAGYCFSEGHHMITEIRKPQDGESYSLSPFPCLPNGYSARVSHDTLYINMPFSNYGTGPLSSTAQIGLNMIKDGVVETIEFGQTSVLQVGYGYSRFEAPLASRRNKREGTYEFYPVYSTTYTTTKDVFGNQETVYTNFQPIALPIGHGHLQVTYTKGTPSLTITDSASGIDMPAIDTKRDNVDGRVYDLSGKIVSKSVMNTLLISGGRKYIVK